MTTQLFDSLDPEAQEDLIRDNVIELVAVRVSAVPDPERPDDRTAMKIVAELSHDFLEGIPWIDEQLTRIREICKPAEEDLSHEVRYLLLKDLNKERDDKAELRAGRIDGQPVAYFNEPFFQELLHSDQLCWVPDETIWCHCWTVAMDDNGKLIIDTEPPHLYNKLDDGSKGRIFERVRKVDFVMGEIVRKMME